MSTVASGSPVAEPAGHLSPASWSSRSHPSATSFKSRSARRLGTSCAVLQDLIRHSLPSGDLATVLDRALDLLLADLERRKIAAAVHPRPATEPKARLTEHPGRGAPRRVEAGRRPVRVQPRRPAVRRTRLHRVPSRASVRGWGRRDGRQHPAALSGAQPVRGGSVLRGAVYPA